MLSFSIGAEQGLAVGTSLHKCLHGVCPKVKGIVPMSEERSCNFLEGEAVRGAPLWSRWFFPGQNPEPKGPFKYIDSGKKTDFGTLLIWHPGITLPQLFVPGVDVIRYAFGTNGLHINF
jgi:hypothetical protein